MTKRKNKPTTRAGKLGEFKLDPDNANRHTERGRFMVERSIRSRGFARPVVASADGTILAGNQATEIAGDVLAANGDDPDVIVVESDGDALIVHVRRDLKTGRSKAARTLAFEDNRTAEVSINLDPDVLLAERAAGRIQIEEFYTDDELADIFKNATLTPPEPDLKQAPELAQKYGAALGQLWGLDAHRLYIGDATIPETTARLFGDTRAALLATDPPYNVGKDYGDDVDDDKVAADYREFTRTWFALWADRSARQIVTPGVHNLKLWLAEFAPYHVGAWIKTNSMTRGFTTRFLTWEPVLQFGEPDDWSFESILFFGDGWQRRRAHDVFNFPTGTHGGVGDHPCPKPFKLWLEFISSYADAGELVGDAFVGSGTAIVAAESSGRILYGAELSPEYAAISLERWAKMTGRTPALITAW